MITIDLATIVNAALTALFVFFVIRLGRSLLNERAIVQIKIESIVSTLSEMENWSNETFRENYHQNFKLKLEEKRMKFSA